MFCPEIRKIGRPSNAADKRSRAVVEDVAHGPA
jgi:hypothetical protein